MLFSSIMVAGAAEAIAATVSAATTVVTGKYNFQNPLTAPPKVQAVTFGYQSLTAKVQTSKAGYTTKSISSSKNVGKSFGSVSSDWLSGPTWACSGTTFSMEYSGYDYQGKYMIIRDAFKLV